MELYFSVWQRVHAQFYIVRYVTKTFGEKPVIYRRQHTDMHIGKMHDLILFILAMFYYLLTCFLDFYIFKPYCIRYTKKLFCHIYIQNAT